MILLFFCVILSSCGSDVLPVETASVWESISKIEEVSAMKYNPIENGLHVPAWLEGRKFKNSYGFKEGIQLPQPALLMCLENSTTVNMALFNRGSEEVSDSTYKLEIYLDPTTNSYGYGGDVIIDISFIEGVFRMSGAQLEEE